MKSDPTEPDPTATLSHRELRNNSGRVLQAVATGESFIVTNRGRPVARLVPVDTATTELSCGRPATKHGGFRALERFRIKTTVSETLEDMRGDR